MSLLGGLEGVKLAEVLRLFARGWRGRRLEGEGDLVKRAS